MMQVHRNLETLPQFKNAVVTIGTFDGVHLGHSQIITQLKEEAQAIGGETVIITFHPHPRNIVGDTISVKLISTTEEKIARLEQHGIHHLVIVPFNEAFANLSAEAYVEAFLFKKFMPHTLIIGYDHKFGKGRKGDYHLLEDYGKKLGFTVKEISEKVLNNIVISSTQIRKALLQSDVAKANELLGYAYTFEGTVIKGDQIGRTIGYPTANIQMDNEDKLVPGDGIYAVTVRLVVNGEKQVDISQSPKTIYHLPLKGMMYIGSRPVVNGKRRVIEVNIFDFDEDIYGKTLRVYVHHYIRGDMKLNGLEDLKRQLAEDKINTLNYLD
jgi:riboflavin kinase/FMN adenylyltransferase